jgi:hypothetical protein
LSDEPYVVGSIDIYEIKAAAFRRITGLMAPGKDESAAAGGASYETRTAVWDLWIRAHGEVINAVIKSTIETLPPLA